MTYKHLPTNEGGKTTTTGCESGSFLGCLIEWKKWIPCIVFFNLDHFTIDPQQKWHVFSHGFSRCPNGATAAPSLASDVNGIPSGKPTKNDGKSLFSIGKSTISMATFNSYVSLPEGNPRKMDGFNGTCPMNPGGIFRLPYLPEGIQHPAIKHAGASCRNGSGSSSSSPTRNQWGEIAPQKNHVSW